MTQLAHPRSPPRGFTLIEVLIVMAVLGILAAIAIPQYSRYIQRGNLVEATNALSAYRVQLEQYYQDNRRYSVSAADDSCGRAVPAGLENFAVTCATANGGQTYTATATGAGNVNGFVYTIDQANARATTGIPASWGDLPADAGTRWIVR